jgi:cysteine desulfurase
MDCGKKLCMRMGARESYWPRFPDRNGGFALRGSPFLFAAVGRGIIGSMQANIPERIYLDHNATTPIFPEVLESMRACWSQPYLNPASQHEFGRRARRTLEDARERIAELLGATTRDRVIFTSGGTESNNLAIRSLLHARSPDSPLASSQPHAIISPIEHHSITTLANHLAQTECHVDNLCVDSNGVIGTDNLLSLKQPNTRFVSAMLVNNETGVLQPIAELAAICNVHNIPLHTDAAQAAGKLPINFKELGAATMTIAAHKFGGPIGIGALLVRAGVELSPILHGGVQQSGVRPGTESVPLAVGMQTALDLWNKNRREWLAQLQSLRSEFETSLKGSDGQIEVLGEKVDRLPTTSNVAFVGLDRQALFVALDQAGVACSTGSACASGSSEPSPTQLAMGCRPAVVSSALRFSFGVQTTLAEVTESTDRIIRISNNLRSQKQS